MSIKVAQNFDYKGKLPNFERDSFISLEQLRDSNPDWFDNGHITYCEETDSHYVFNRNNEYDEETGYFRIFKMELDENLMDGIIHQGENAPDNTDMFWLDTSEGYENTETVATIEGLQEAVRILTAEVNKISSLRTNGVVAGTVSDSVRVYLSNQGEAIEPETGLEKEDEILDENGNPTTTPAPDYSDLEEVKPEYDDASEPNVPHISIKMGTYSQLQAYIKNFIPGELLWCTNKKKLYIYINGQLVVVAGGSTTDDDDDENNGGITDMDTQEILNLINGQLQQVESIGFIPVGSTEPKYTMKVSKEGTLLCYDKTMDSWAPAKTSNYYFDIDDSVNGSGLLINSFYLGGDGDEHSYQPCSHNYVEISNVWMEDKTAVQKDINLNGFYLLYLNPTDNKWRSLPLWGTIKANSTFVIRGKQCSVMDSNTTVIKVKNYDMEWNEVIGYTDPVLNEDGEVIKDSEPIYDLIKFPQGPSAVFYLAWSDPNKPGNLFILGKDESVSLDEFPTDTNVLISTDKNVGIGTAKGYCDLASFNHVICETKTYTLPSNASAKDVLFRRWYPMDPVGQSNPDDGVEAHSNVKYLTSTYLNGSNWDDKIPVEEWTPKASWEGKSMRETRSLFLEHKPNTLTITFGYQASDNSEDGGIGAGRGFCWNSVGYYDEYLWIRREGDNEWVKVESLKDGVTYLNDGDVVPSTAKKVCNSKDFGGLFVWPNSVTSDADGNSYVEYFARQRWESSYGQDMTTHKVVIGGLKAGKYEYKVVRGTDESSSYQSKVRNFTVRADKDIKNFSYVQTTDQQGVTWEEWETWVLTARMMKKNYVKDIDLIEPGPKQEELGQYTKHQYYTNGEPKYNITDINHDKVYVSKYSNDEVTVNVQVDDNKSENKVFKGCTTDINRANIKTYQVGTIPQDYGFIVNTGDVCYNGSRSNEWLEYFYGQEPLDDREEMLCVGNNDLIPVTMRDIGTGQESPWKVNPAVIDYFYAVDFDTKNPPVFLGKPNGEKGDTWDPVKFKIPGLYAWNYGEFHFVCLLSEIRTISNKITISKNEEDKGAATVKKLKQSTVNLVWGVEDELRGDGKNQSASKIYDTVEGWITKDLLYWKGATTEDINEKYHPTGVTATNLNFDWQSARFDERLVDKCKTCIFFAHEMPFNITSSSNYGNYEAGAEAPRETAKAYLNRFHNFEFQRVFKLWSVPMVMGGHKHTCAMTMPVYDAPDGYNPITKKMDDKYYGELKDKDGNPITIGYYLDKDEYDQLLHDITINSDGDAYKLNDRGIFSQPASFRPIIQLTSDEYSRLKENMLNYSNEFYNNSNKTIQINDTITLAPGEKYIIEFGEASYKTYPRCRVELVDKITSPTYIMCQTSGFKNKSNSDLACESKNGIIPWERFYVKGDAIKEQCAPFYTVYKVITRDDDGNKLNDPRIEVNMYRVSGLYEDTGGPKGGSPDGYWSLAKIYCHGETLEENRAYFVGGEFDSKGEAKLEKYGDTTIIKLSI